MIDTFVALCRRQLFVCMPWVDWVLLCMCVAAVIRPSCGSVSWTIHCHWGPSLIGCSRLQLSSSRVSSFMTSMYTWHAASRTLMTARLRLRLRLSVRLVSWCLRPMVIDTLMYFAWQWQTLSDIHWTVVSSVSLPTCRRHQPACLRTWMIVSLTMTRLQRRHQLRLSAAVRVVIIKCHHNQLTAVDGHTTGQMTGQRQRLSTAELVSVTVNTQQ